MAAAGFQGQSIELDSSGTSRKQSAGKFHRKNHSSSPPLFRRQDFPSLAESVSIRRRKKGHGPPFDKDGRSFSSAVKDGNFPFSEIEEDALTLKFAPIKLCWLKRSNSLNNLGRGVAEVNTLSEKGHFREERWFRAPPKVRLVAGILGSSPGVSTRGVHLQSGEGNKVDDLESRHPTLDSSYLVRGGLDYLDQANPKEQKVPKSSNLARFVGHLWKGAPSKSFVAAVRIVTAPTVAVMLPRGDDRGGGFGANRGGYGYTRGGFNRGAFGRSRGGYGGRGFGPNRGGGGRQGEGGGQMDLRPNSWKRKEVTPVGEEKSKSSEEESMRED